MINNLTIPQNVTGYLKRYDSSLWMFETSHQTAFNNIVVIPAIDEYDNLQMLINSLLENDETYFDETLFVFVINNKLSSSNEVKKDNAKAIGLLRQVIACSAENELAVKLLKSKIKIALVDAASAGKELPEKDAGVGLARKIGMDLALNLFNYSSNKKKILICLDADCTVERNYLSAIVSTFNENEMSAACVRYEHKFPEDEREKLATVCYEIFLRYYLLGLTFAKSPFAFQVVGSTMICDAESYIKVGGMNKRKAAEDFYFLEKLAKITHIHKIDTTKVYPSCRGSWRVPFGTGQRINRYIAGTHDEYSVYDPNTFQVLKLWLEIFNSGESDSSESILQSAKSFNEGLYEFLLQNNFNKDWENILGQSKSDSQIKKQKIIWFDNFRTMKLIHFLRDHSFPQLNMFDALDKLFEMMNYNTGIHRNEIIPSLPIQLEYLDVLRKLT